MSQKLLQILNQKKIKIDKSNLTYVLLEDNHVYLSQKEFNKYLGITNKDGKPIIYQDDNSILFEPPKGGVDIGLPLDKALNLCSNKIEEMLKGNHDVSLLFKCISFSTALAEIGIKSLISEIETTKPEQESEPDNDVKFDDLLEGLMRVPPPKKGK